MKKIIPIFLLLATMFTVNAQVNFKEKNLALLEKIAFTTSYKTIKAFMKDNNYTFQEESDNELGLSNDDYLEVIFVAFKGPFGNNIVVGYGKKDKVFLMIVNQIASITTAFCEIELKDESFKIKEQSENGKCWTKSSYKYQIGTENTDEKTHRLVFISPSHPDFVK